MNFEEFELLKNNLVKKGKEVLDFERDLYKRSIPQNREGNGLDEKFTEYAILFEHLLTLSKIESVFWEYCTFETYKIYYSHRVSCFFEVNEEVDELFFLQKEKHYLKNMMSGKLLLNNTDPQNITHNHETAWGGFFGSISEPKKRWIKREQELKMNFIENRIEICEKEEKARIKEVIDFDPFKTVLLIGYKSDYSEIQKQLIYKAFRGSYIDCSERDFMAFLSGGILNSQIIWKKTSSGNNPHKTALRDFIELLGFKVDIKKVKSLFCDTIDKPIIINKAKKGEYSNDYHIIRKIISEITNP